MRRKSAKVRARVANGKTILNAAIESLEVRRLLATTLPAGYAETVFRGGLAMPTAMATAPDGRIFVVQAGGSIRVVHTDGTLVAGNFLTLPEPPGQEQGPINLAFDPNFATNHWVYVYYTKAVNGGDVNRLSRFTISTNNADVADPNTEVDLLDSPQKSVLHTGGLLEFGADGMLYLGIGDDFGDGSNGAHAQDLSDLHGKILRLNVDAYPKSIIPSDNPFVGTAGRGRRFGRWGSATRGAGR